MTEFIWSATECAPKGYPMEIISGTFLFKGEDHGLYIPDGGTLTGVGEIHYRIMELSRIACLTV